jgi:hypothetical protein
MWQCLTLTPHQRFVATEQLERADDVVAANLAEAVLDRVIESVAHATFEQLVEALTAEQLGSHERGVALPGSPESDRVTVPQRDYQGVTTSPAPAPEFSSGSEDDDDCGGGPGLEPVNLSVDSWRMALAALGDVVDIAAGSLSSDDSFGITDASGITETDLPSPRASPGHTVRRRVSFGPPDAGPVEAASTLEQGSETDLSMRPEEPVFVVLSDQRAAGLTFLRVRCDADQLSYAAVELIHAGSYAAEVSPPLRPGMLLHQVNGETAVGLSLPEVDRRCVARPVELAFFPPPADVVFRRIAATEPTALEAKPTEPATELKCKGWRPWARRARTDAAQGDENTPAGARMPRPVSPAQCELAGLRQRGASALLELSQNIAGYPSAAAAASRRPPSGRTPSFSKSGIGGLLCCSSPRARRLGAPPEFMDLPPRDAAQVHGAFSESRDRRRRVCQPQAERAWPTKPRLAQP